MPLQHTDHQPQRASERTVGADADTMCFRAPTLDEAIAVAEEALGTRVRVVAANRIRRGGIGGFFASDLGVEVTVALDEETIEQALERLVAESAAEERDQWLDRSRERATPTGEADVSPRTPIDVATTAARATGPTIVRVEQIIEELQALTAAPLFGDERVRPTIARMRRAEELAASAGSSEPLAATDLPTTEMHVAHLDTPIDRVDATVVEPIVEPAAAPAGRVSFPPSPGEIARAASAAAAAKSHTFRRELRTPAAVDAVIEAAGIETAGIEAGVVEASVPELAPAPAAPTPARASSGAPSRRQVELAVAAADQLIDSLKHDDGVKRLSVRVVLRTGDQREVAAEAEWEAS